MDYNILYVQAGLFIRPMPFIRVPMKTAETFLLAMIVIFTIPYLVWRVFKTDFFAPLVVVQIITGIILGPGLMGNWFPDVYETIFRVDVIKSLDGIAWWAVMIFVLTAGIELDVKLLKEHRRDAGITAASALIFPLVTGSIIAFVALTTPGWIGPHGSTWQFVLGVGMSCAVTALPILVLFLEKLTILRTPFGQRVLRYASFDDVAIWGVLALILLDWERIQHQALFLAGYVVAAFLFRHGLRRISEADRRYVIFIWLALCGWAADWCGLHFMVGSFLAGVVIDAELFDQRWLDSLRRIVLMTIMPVFFLSTGLKTSWTMGGSAVFLFALGLLFAAIAGKLIGVRFAGSLLGWRKGEASVVGWLLQTKALIMIIFSNILLDRGIISSSTFTALLLMAVLSTMLTIPMINKAVTELGLRS